MFNVKRVGLCGGLALFWQEQVEVQIWSFNYFFIDIRVQWAHGKAWPFIGFYGVILTLNKDIIIGLC